MNSCRHGYTRAIRLASVTLAPEELDRGWRRRGGPERRLRDWRAAGYRNDVRVESDGYVVVRRGDEASLDAGTERPHPVADDAVQRMAAVVDRTGANAVIGRIVLDKKAARGIVTIVSMGDDRRSPNRRHRQHRRRGD